MKRFKYRWDVTWFWGFNNNTSKRILDELETVCLGLREIEVEGVEVIKLRVNNGGGVGTSCFKIKIRTDATKLTNVRITRFRQCRDLVRVSEMFIKDKAKICKLNKPFGPYESYLSINNKARTVSRKCANLMKHDGCETVIFKINNYQVFRYAISNSYVQDI